MKSKIQNNNIKQKDIYNKFKPLKDILKEKILYDYYCNKHNMNYFKYCSLCKKDICVQCEKDLHKGHQFINYENILPDLNEINIMHELLKEYEKNYHLFIDIINNWKKEFEIILNEYKVKMNNLIDFIFNFNNEKINFNSIYKYRSIFSILLNPNSDKNKKNSKIIEIMERMMKNKENIKNEYNWVLNNNKFKELLSSINNDIFSNKIKKIVEVVNIKERNNICNNGIIIKKISGKINNRVNNNINEITPCFNAQIKNNSSSDKNNNTSASSVGKNKLKKMPTENDSNQNMNKNNGVINFEYTFNKDYKSNHSKSTNNVNYNNKKMNKFNLCIYEKKKIRQKSTDYAKNIKNLKLSINNNNNINQKIEMNENTLQNSINDTKIYLFKKRQRRNKHFINKNMISNKTQNIINKTFLYNYKGFDIYDRDSGPELLNNTSSTIQGVKYVSTSLRNNSMDYATNKNPYFNKYTGEGKNYIRTTYSIDNNNNNIFTVDKNSTCNILNNYRNFNKNSSLCGLSRNEFKMNNNLNNTSIRFYRPHKNNSVENINFNSKHKINNSFVNNNNSTTAVNDNKLRLIYDNKKKDNSIYINKKFITLDMSKSLSSIDSITSSIISSNSTNRNKNGNTNNIFLNQINNNINNTNSNTNNQTMYKNKTYNINKSKGNRLFIGLELGNTECKIGLLKQKSDFEKSFNQSEYYSIPTVISFLSNKVNNNPKNVFEIKIGEEAKKFELINPSQTIFNIIKLFGKNTNEIIGRKDLWPFNIYNDSQTNKPIIKIKYNNSKDDKNNKFVYYNFEEILTIYLKKVFEMFFTKIKLNKDNKENYNINTDKIEDINIDINIGVPNYFNYLQRKLIQKIFTTHLFPKKDIGKYNNIKVKKNILGKFNIQLNHLKVENVSNLASFYLISKFINNNPQKIYKNNLFLYMEGGSVNISIINFSINNNNYFIEVKAINGAEFGEEDFLDNFISDCLSDFKDKIRNNCLNSPLALAKLRKSLNITKKCFDKGEFARTEVNIDKLFGNLDLKMTVNQMSYQKSCMGLFRKIIYLIKDTIINSKIDIKDINDIILIGNMTQNIQLKKFISEIFKDNNKDIYNKLINENNNYNNDIDSSIIKGSIIQSFNSNMIIPKYKLISICESSFGIENTNGFMDIVIEKGSIIPIKFNKYIRIRKLRGSNMVNINIYEGENKCVRNNKLIASNYIDITNFKQERKDDKSIEILFQFYMDSNNNLNVYILDKISFRRQFECLMNINND